MRRSDLHLACALLLVTASAAAGASRLEPASRPVQLLDDLLLFLLANIGALVLAATMVRLWREAAARRDERFRVRWEPALFSRMSGELNALPALRPGERLMFLRLWLRLLAYIRHEAATAVVQAARELQLCSYVLRLLQSRSDWKRVLGMQAAGLLELKDARETLISKIAEHRPHSSLAAVRALLSIDPEKGLEGLQLVLRQPHWPSTAVLEIVNAAGPRGLELLSSMVPSALPGRAKALVRLIELTENRSALPALRERLQFSRDDEEVAALVHALGTLGDPEDRETVTSHALHANWLVRMQVASALGALGDEADIDRLLTLLRDRTWWVRYRAAQSLLRIVGAAALGLLRSNETDPYANQMLERVLAEGG